MSISPGTRLGAYEVLALIGSGGMGEVYRARDTRLDRTVAIKVLPTHVASDPDLRQRFEREARAVAALNHPHICTLYDVGHQDGIDFLVMEYLEGETLAKRLEKGALPLDQALTVAIQIAGALDKAHRHGIVHRDLKPGNIMLKKSGAKLLDFGLAKTGACVVAGAGVSMLPTTPPNLTAQGTILGTFQYMAPEQLEGQDADARTDIFAFGSVVYEMLTGKKAFEGKSQASLIAAIISSDPLPIAASQPLTPPALDRIVRKCLAKEPDNRWQTARDLFDELNWIADSGSETAETARITAGAVPSRDPRRRAIPLSTAGVLAVIVAVIASIAAWNLKLSAPLGSPAVARLTVALPPGEELVVDFPAVAVSPGGTQLVYVARRGGIQQLYVRSMASLESKPISGTEGAVTPFFSPDGEWVGFFTEGKLKKVRVTGGFPLILCDAAGAWGGSWAPNDTIFFAPGSVSALWQVSANGGTPQIFTKLERQKGEISHRWPRVLPGGKAVLFTVHTGPGWDEQQVQLQMLETGERRILVQGGHSGYYVPTGHLVYSRQGTLMAVPFSLPRLEVAGSSPVAVAEEVLESSEGVDYAVSGNGLLAYIPGGPRQYERSLVWVDRNGKIASLAAPSRPYQSLRFSPDGQHVALATQGAKHDVWLYNFARGISTRLTSEGSSQFPIWTPDGTRLTYRATRAGTRNLFWRMADGNGAEERLTTGEGNQSPGAWSPDGQTLVFTDINNTTGYDLWVFRFGDRKQQPFLRTPFNEQSPMFSPDGRWLAYASNESGRLEIYVERYPGPGGRSRISTEGGTEPVWNRNGRELFYRQGDSIVAVDVAPQPNFSAGKPRMLVEGQRSPPGALRTYDVSPNGQRFLMINPSESEGIAATQINVVQNWFEELKRLVPAER